MKLLKFNLLFLPLLALVLVGVAMIARELLEANARDHVSQVARLIMETASSSRVYTTKQVAQALQISERQVFRLIQKRVIKPTKIGTSLRVKVSWLDQWVANLTEDELAHLGEL